ncbi:Der GTPase-activating protein YihI [Orbus wheelerorum]|uniref:Der GTPase-activating protein YihI n=1 Tax=Orbus wheelerorum TaxID=3074111 RepID=UPI00370D4B83
MIKKKPKQSREEINEKSKQLKRKRKHKGLPSGSRFKSGESDSSKSQKEVHDSRIGSKKAIPLIATKPTNKPAVKKASDTAIKQTPEQELKQLENDPYLEKLLDLIDEGEALTSKQQQDLDRILDRIDALMKLLGYTDEDDDLDDEDDDFATKEDIVGLLKKR